MDPHLEQLKSYIQSQLQTGLHPDEITAQLRGAGWPDSYIHQAFTQLQQQMMPTHFAAQPVPQSVAPEESVAPTVEPQPQAQPQPGVMPQANGRRRGRLKTSFMLLRQSTKLLFGNKYLLRYMLMTGIWVVVIAVGFIAAILLLDQVAPEAVSTGSGDQAKLGPLGYIAAFFYYLAIYYIVNLYAAGLTANILDIFKGDRRPYHSYMHLARSKAGPLFVFSLIAATVGIFLEYIAERFKFIGTIISWILGAVWSLGTMFVVPIIVTSDKPSAPRSIKQSIKFFKQTWGENVASKVGVNIALFYINLSAIITLVILGILLVSTLGAFGLAIILGLWVILVVTLAVLGTFANSLINVSLYYYAVHHQVPPAFSADLLNSVFVKRKRRFFKKINDTPPQQQ